jgi:hypothetical protein
MSSDPKREENPSGFFDLPKVEDLINENVVRVTRPEP